MRHGNKTHYLGRTASHRKATMANMACSLIEHKRITTTLAKAKALREYVEPLITKSKDDTTHSRRTVFSYLQSKDTIKILFDEVSRRIADRPGGYTRILKIGPRKGDNAEMALIELVDYNELLTTDSKPKRKRSRRGGSGSASTEAKATHAATKAETAPAEEVKAEAPAADVEKPKAEAPVVEQPQAEAPVAEETVAETTEPEAEATTQEPKAEADDVEETKEEKNEDKKEDKE